MYVSSLYVHFIRGVHLSLKINICKYCYYENKNISKENIYLNEEVSFENWYEIRFPTANVSLFSVYWDVDVKFQLKKN